MNPQDPNQQPHNQPNQAPVAGGTPDPNTQPGNVSGPQQTAVPMYGPTGTQPAMQRGAGGSKKMIVLIIAVALLLLIGAAAALFVLSRNSDSDQGNNSANSPSTEAPETSEAEEEATIAEYEIETSLDYDKVCSNEGWPSNVTASASGDRSILLAQTAIDRESFRSVSGDYIPVDQEIDYDDVKTLDRVVCFTRESEIGRKTCAFNNGDGTMIQYEYTVKVHDLTSKTVVDEFKVGSDSDCPFLASMNSDREFVAEPSRSDTKAKL